METGQPLLPFCPFGPESSTTCSPAASLRWAAVSPPTRPPPPPRDPCRCCTGPAPFPTRRRSVQLDEVQPSGECDGPATGTSSQFRATQAPSHRIANCPPTSVCLIHDLDRDPTPPGHAKISRRQRHPDRRAAPLVVPGRPQLQPNSRPSAACGGAGALVPGLVRRWKWTVDSGQSTADRAPSLRPKKKSERSNSQKSEPLPRCLLSTLHRDRPMLPQPSPNPSNAPVSVPRPPSPSPSSASPRASAAAKLLSPVVASRPSLTRVARLPHAPARTRDALPPPPRLSTPERVN